MENNIIEIKCYVYDFKINNIDSFHDFSVNERTVLYFKDKCPFGENGRFYKKFHTIGYREDLKKGFVIYSEKKLKLDDILNHYRKWFNNKVSKGKYCNIRYYNDSRCNIKKETSIEKKAYYNNLLAKYYKYMSTIIMTYSYEYMYCCGIID